MRHFLQRWPGSFLLSMFMFMSINVTGGLWLDAVKRRADVLLPYMGTEVDVKLRRNGDVSWKRWNLDSQSARKQRDMTDSESHAHLFSFWTAAQLRTAPITFIALVVFSNISTMVSDDTSASMIKALNLLNHWWEYFCCDNTDAICSLVFCCAAFISKWLVRG